jgi:DNA repair ATPase RecN
MGYIAIGLTLVVAVVFYVLWSKQRSEIAAQLKVLQATRDELEKLRQEVANRASQVSILTGEIARIEQMAEQQGADSKLSDIQVLAHQLRAELQKANDRLAKDEETFAAFANTLDTMKTHQEKLDVALSSDKFFELVEQKTMASCCCIFATASTRPC